jgi:RHH-type rel operon transcriptional repressor/antitoxin RelB
MAISLRLKSDLDHKLSRIAREQGMSKSDIVRKLIADFMEKRSRRRTAWELGKNSFGRFGSGKGNLSRNRKSILKERLRAKKSHY